MIEWIIGAAALGGWIFGSDKKPNRIRKTSLLKTSEPSLSIRVNSNFSGWRKTWEESIDYTKWIPNHIVAKIIEEHPPFRNASTEPTPISEIPSFKSALHAEFNTHNAKYSERQKSKLKDFFSSVENNPLTDEQMDSCICMDDAVQIVAAAGSGKTSTIVARVGYVLEEGLALPEQILILAFNSSVKIELETRIKERLSRFQNIERISVKTFNAFGLEVIGKSTERKPKLADWTLAGKDIEVISEIVEELRHRDIRFRLDWDMFRTVYGRDIGQMEGFNETRLDTRNKGNILTADGNYVKSLEERMICDFLFYHGVQYEYERPYEHDTVSDQHSQYHPDFYYPRIDLYHEHFALDAHGKAPEHFSGEYVEGALWKRALHEEKNTLFFETTSHGLRNGDDFERLKLELEQHGEILEFDENRPPSGQDPIPTIQLATTIRTFQQHVKSNSLSHVDLHNLATQHKRGHRARLSRFVRLYERIADEWQRRLQIDQSVDFDDMLLGAITHIENGTYQSPFKMVFADEFQDVSQAKLRLLKALMENAGPSSKLCVVGDDWQGINRFAGADITVMTDFHKTFHNASVLTLSKTFRCPQILCDASSEFIQKNPRQIQKSVNTNNQFNKTPLQAFAFEDSDSALDDIENTLKSMHEYAQAGKLGKSENKKLSVMLLGRYRKDAPVSHVKKWNKHFGNQLLINFSTAHASKGLEADYVMLLNVNEGLMGFPSQIVDDPVLQLAMPEPDEFPLAEERRLFYVALTRARRQTRIYCLRDKPSRFVVELAKAGNIEIKAGRSTLKLCPKCELGTLSKKMGNYGPFLACSAHPECDYTKKIVPLGSVNKKSAQSVRLKERMSEGASCPTCNQGVMVVRSVSNSEPFLGCSSFPRCRTTASIL